MVVLFGCTMRFGFCASSEGERFGKVDIVDDDDDDDDDWKRIRTEFEFERRIAHAASARSGALLIICRRLSSSREESSLERFSVYSRFSSFIRVVALLVFFS